ncbi:MAG: hypothetical protein ACPGD8_07730 [Flavobacteriales bacterium]
MSKILYIEEYFEPFKASWGSMAVAQKFTDGYQMPDGWQNELDKKGIKYTVIDLVKHREALTEELIQAATAFGLGEFISVLFFNLRTLIRDFEQNGGTGLHDFFASASEKDYPDLYRKNADGVTPRDYALQLLKDYKP